MKNLILLFLFAVICNNILKAEDYSNQDVIQNDFDISREKIQSFIDNELLNGIKYQESFKDKDGVINTYGNPIEDRIKTIKPFSFEGGTVIGIRELIYNDFIHTYYIFENGNQLYASVEYNNKLGRVKKINIGNTFEELKIAFGNHYYEGKGENIIYYGKNVEVIFLINEKIIQSIQINYLLI
ncbi:hypothetical protein [Breznakiella homolactica]|uniref:Uncharacterized protein n=1 Tax=Breznakiella homolactica TaxID=2798577 RepID=A0A7T8BCJ9_9SPIR|nr:hypothetical protein [Breznakiella homolactica]QQO10353.1 hypothetical protein JFL75_05390 [Breznakiella homolactica]